MMMINLLLFVWGLLLLLLLLLFLLAYGSDLG